VTINGALSTPSYHLALIWELSNVPWGLTEIAEAKQARVRRTNQILFCTTSKKGSGNRSSRFEPKDLVDFVFEGFRSNLQIVLEICPVAQLTASGWTR